MSFNSNSSVKAMEEKLERLDRLYKEMAGILVANPGCLEGNPRKAEITQNLIFHLKAKMEQSQSEEAEKQPNRALVIRLGVLVDCFDEGENLKYAGKVMETLINLSVEEMRYVPNDLKKRAIVICEQYFR